LRNVASKKKSSAATSIAPAFTDAVPSLFTLPSSFTGGFFLAGALAAAPAAPRPRAVETAMAITRVFRMGGSPQKGLSRVLRTAARIGLE
jgi:hypothetical protein